MNPKDLIRHGFINNFETNCVECLCCRLTITCEAILLCDDLDRLHRELSPQCRIVRNIFLSQERPAGQLRAAECLLCRDEPPWQDTLTGPPSVPEDVRRDNPLRATGAVSVSDTADGLSKLKVDQLLQREIAAETTQLKGNLTILNNIIFFIDLQKKPHFSQNNLTIKQIKHTCENNLTLKQK